MARTKSIRNEPKCTPEEFDAAIELFSLDPATVARVRRVLVEGVPPPIAAHEDGVSQQLLHRQYTKVIKKIIEHRAPPLPTELIVPPGWEAATIVAPADFIALVKKQLADYLKTPAASTPP